RNASGDFAVLRRLQRGQRQRCVQLAGGGQQVRASSCMRLSQEIQKETRMQRQFSSRGEPHAEAVAAKMRARRRPLATLGSGVQLRRNAPAAWKPPVAVLQSRPSFGRNPFEKPTSGPE